MLFAVMLQMKSGCQNQICSTVLSTYQAVLSVPEKTSDCGGRPDEPVSGQHLCSTYWKMGGRR